MARNAKTAQVTVKVFDCSTRIGVCIERCGWAHSFEIKLKNGCLPAGYEGDPEIVEAYRKIQQAALLGGMKG